MSKAKLTSLLFLGFIGRIAETLTLYVSPKHSETMYADWYTALKNKDYFRSSFFIFLYRAVRLQPSSAAVLLTLP